MIAKKYTGNTKLPAKHSKKSKRFRSKSRRHFGELRMADRVFEWHGFVLQPGMFYGLDESGLFVTWAVPDGDRYDVWRKPERSTAEWVSQVEPVGSTLWHKMNELPEASITKSQYYRDVIQVPPEIRALKREARREIQKQERKAERAKKLLDKQATELASRVGLRMSKADYIFRPLGRPAFANQFSADGVRTEFGTEKHSLDVSPIPNYRIMSRYENPQVPESETLYTRI